LNSQESRGRLDTAAIVITGRQASRRGPRRRPPAHRGGAGGGGVHDLHAWDYYGRRIAPRARLRQGMEAEPDQIMPLSPRGPISRASRDRNPRSREPFRMARVRGEAEPMRSRRLQLRSRHRPGSIFAFCCCSRGPRRSRMTPAIAASSGPLSDAKIPPRAQTLRLKRRVRRG
jgi:hypothetical protein